MARCGPPWSARSDAAVLVPEGNLEVKHFLPRTLEAEVAGFDDAGVYRTHGDFVHLATLDTEERTVRRGVPRRLAAPA